MADLSQIKMPNNTTYDLKDATARTELAPIPNADIDAIFEDFMPEYTEANGVNF